jgi:tagatose-6-phosphate ketose/aldose isomerase
MRERIIATDRKAPIERSATPAAAVVSSLLGLDPELLRTGGGHVTAAEIAQQPALWRGLPTAVEARRTQLQALLEPLLRHPALRIVLTGAGTSAFIGHILAPALTGQLGRRVDAVATTDLVSNPGSYLAEDVPTLLVSFARSGDSPESTAATQLADQYLSECRHLVLTCHPDGALARQHSGSDRSLVLAMPAAANDAGFAMTSSFTCMMLSALLVLAPELVDVELLAASAEEALRSGGELAARLTGRGFERVVYLGSGPLKGLAEESALKMLELTAGRVATWHDSPLGFRHGPKSVLDERTLVVAYVSADPYTRQYDVDMITQLRASMEPSSVIAIEGHQTSDLDDAARAAVLVIPAQIFALHCSLGLGLTPDNPFPSGFVTRVVHGVTIHPHTV